MDRTQTLRPSSAMTHPLDPEDTDAAFDGVPKRAPLRERPKPPARVAFLDTKAANTASPVAGNKRGYVKPVQGIQTKGFAQSGQ